RGLGYVYKRQAYRLLMVNTYHRGFRSVYKLTAHLVLVTKYRKPVINREIMDRLDKISCWCRGILDWKSRAIASSILIAKLDLSKSVKLALVEVQCDR
ncbi:MAG: transposase, partial [Spirulina sp.]